MTAYEILNIAPNATTEEIRTAYRTLARRWHPDRFMEGPERDWANNKMAEINAAYRQCLSGRRDARAAVENDASNLADARRMIDDGLYTSARKKLMGMNTRCAEWNYLFGWLLLKNKELDKALIYLSVAVHQDPKSELYARALEQAERRIAPGRLSKLLAKMR